MFLITSVTKRRYFVCRVHETWQTAIAASCGLKNEDASLSKLENGFCFSFIIDHAFSHRTKKKTKKFVNHRSMAMFRKKKPMFVNKSLRMCELLEGSGRKRQKKTDTFRFSTSSRFLGPSNQFFFSSFSFAN